MSKIDQLHQLTSNLSKKSEKAREKKLAKRERRIETKRKERPWVLLWSVWRDALVEHHPDLRLARRRPGEPSAEAKREMAMLKVLTEEWRWEECEALVRFAVEKWHVLTANWDSAPAFPVIPMIVKKQSEWLSLALYCQELDNLSKLTGLDHKSAERLAFLESKLEKEGLRSPSSSEIVEPNDYPEQLPEEEIPF